jgi:hypothetical protein
MIDMKNETKLLMKQRKETVTEGWLKSPKEVPYYRDSWSWGDRYNKPLDWYQQESEYDKKGANYEEKWKEYEEFCSQKLEQSTEIGTLTSSKEEEREKLRKRKMNGEKLLEFIEA